MLAERKKKTFYSNPRGTLWANDKEKFGQKLLSKMGWKEGNGLGKNQGGITESLKANFKFDNNGLGFQRKANEWIEDNNVYDQILADLAQHHQQPLATETAGKNVSDSEKQTNTIDLVEKSKVTGRLLYRHRFIKAKNLSMKSQTDVACIFGKSAPSNNNNNKPASPKNSVPTNYNDNNNSNEDEAEEEPLTTTITKCSTDEDDDEQTKREQEEERARLKKEKKKRKKNKQTHDANNNNEDENESKKEDGYFRTIQSKLSVQDYFKQKMAEKLQNRKTSNTATSSIPTPPPPPPSAPVEEEESERQRRKKLKKSKKRKHEQVDDGQDE